MASPWISHLSLGIAVLPFLEPSTNEIQSVVNSTGPLFFGVVGGTEL
jgi:hypothetical protein